MNLIQKLVDYVRSAKAGAFKVSWPSKQDTIRYSSLVIGVSVAVALSFTAIDYGFTQLFNATLLQQVARNHAAQQAALEHVTATTTPAQPEAPKLDIEAVSTTTNVKVVK